MCTLVVCGERNRRDANTGSDGGAVALSAGRGSDRIASRGTRSCSSSSVAWTRGSAWKRATKTSSADDVGERDERHALVMREVGAHDRRPCGRRPAASSTSRLRGL